MNIIYTGYFARVKQYQNVTPISISRYSPRWLPDVIQYPILSPTPYILEQYKSGNINDYQYIQLYMSMVLHTLDRFKVLMDLKELSGDKPPILLCYETPDKFCHRHLVTKWLSSIINISEHRI